MLQCSCLSKGLSLVEDERERQRERERERERDGRRCRLVHTLAPSLRLGLGRAGLGLGSAILLFESWFPCSFWRLCWWPNYFSEIPDVRPIFQHKKTQKKILNCLKKNFESYYTNDLLLFGLHTVILLLLFIEVFQNSFLLLAASQPWAFSGALPAGIRRPTWGVG